MFSKDSDEKSVGYVTISFCLSAGISFAIGLIIKGLAPTFEWYWVNESLLWGCGIFSTMILFVFFLAVCAWIDIKLEDDEKTEEKVEPAVNNEMHYDKWKT